MATDATTPGLSRRHALCGTALAALGLPVLAACGGEEPTATGTPSGSGSSSGSGPGSPGSSGSGPGSPGSSASGASGALASTSEIPEGSGVVFADEGVVVTQPTAGEFRAFSNICTHQRCPVNAVTETINCPCHGSSFALDDGAPTSGPATEPLGAVRITVEGDQILRG